MEVQLKMCFCIQNVMGAFPRMQVLIMVDYYVKVKPAIGFTYKGMDRIKEKIQKEFNDDKKMYFTNLPIEISYLDFTFWNELKLDTNSIYFSLSWTWYLIIW